VITGAAPTAGEIYVLDCGAPTTTQVAATATDDVEAVSATLRWTDAAGVPGSAAMEFFRAKWRATLGPVTNAGPVSWVVTVADAEGNASSAAGRITAFCPVIG
jgi:hypothetical protein